ncbi:MAG: DEDD exonuclease domain-containing protein [Bacteroidota bacterium]
MPDPRSVLIDEATFVVTDTETTGTKAGEARVIEIAAVKVQGGEIVDRFSQLIDPGRSVPGRITRLTGISTAMVFGQPSAQEVMPAFMDFLGDGVFVAHNAGFDERFVQAELARMDEAPFDNDILCTLRLARRLLKGLRSKGLGHVADFYKIKIEGRHRAAGDAEATALILLRFLEDLKHTHDLETLQDVLAFQNRTYQRGAKAPRHLRKIRTEILPQLPPRPGVYYMMDAQERVLYVGKAKRLDRRVRSYFTAIEAKPQRLLKLVQSVRKIRWDETPSELEALLLESKQIKNYLPTYNRALRRYRNRPFLRLDTTADYPAITWTSHVHNDGAAYYGPLGGRRQAELMVDIINRTFLLRECEDDRLAHGERCLYADMGRCEAPCEDPQPERYAEEVTRVERFLRGEETGPVLDLLEAAMHKAATEFDFEGAAQYRDWHRALTRLLDKQQHIAAPVFEHHAVLLHPTEDQLQAFLVRYGRHVATVPLPPDGPLVDSPLPGQIRTHFAEDSARPEHYWKPEIDEVRILAHWLYVHRDEVTVVRWRPGQTADDLVAATQQAIQTLEARATVS